MSSYNTRSTRILSGNEKAVNQHDLDETSLSQHESDTNDTEPLINKNNISNTIMKKNMPDYKTNNKKKKYFHNANNAQSSISENNALMSDCEMEIDVLDELEKKVKNNFDASVSESKLEIGESVDSVDLGEKNENHFDETDNSQPSTSGNNAFTSEFDDLEEKNGNNFDEVDNPQPSTSGNNASVSDFQLESMESQINDDLILQFVNKIICHDESETVKRPRRLMLNDDKKRIYKKDLMKAVENSKAAAKKIFKRTVKRNFELGNTKYMPGPKSMTKDLNYHLQEQCLASLLPMPPSDGPYSQSLKIICYQLNGSCTRVFISWNMKMTPWLSKAKLYELYLCKEFKESRQHLIWRKIDSNVRPNSLYGRCTIDVKRGFNYHFGLRVVDSYGRRVPFSIAQRWI